MITGKEAKEKADSINAAKAYAELEEVLKYIKNKSQKGEYSCSYHTLLMDENVTILTQLGFIITTGGRMNEVETTIQWSKPNDIK